MAEPNVDEINTATRKNILPGLVDNFFKNGPVMRFLKEKRLKIFTGGSLIQEGFSYKPMKGGPYSRGDSFDITRRQTKAALQFVLKTYEVNVTEFIEDIEIELRGEEAVFDMVRTDMGNAALTMSAILEIACMRHGQPLAGDNRSKHMSGFEEALNDGINASFAGNLFPAYGGQTRADVSPALTPPTGLINANVNGPIQNRVLEHSYQSCVIGEEHPVLGVTTTRCMGYINENYLPLQRLQDTVEPTIGWPGLKFKQATIVESNYMPGADGVNDPDIGNYLTADGRETFLWLNPGPAGDDAHFRLWMSASPKFQFGFTGFKVGRDDTMVAGQILAAVQFTCRAVRLMRFLFGING